jgi:hypothetical protein
MKAPHHRSLGVFDALKKLEGPENDPPRRAVGAEEADG